MKFGVKLVLNGIILVPLLLWFTDASFLAILLASVILCIISYIVGDQMILRATNNTVATIADAILAFIYFWVISVSANWGLSMTELILLVVALGAVEAVFHRMLANVDRVRA